MGWAYCGTDYYGREIGYGIPATCDRRGCDEEIDRGLGYICGQMHHGPFDAEPGCGRYYCEADRGWLGDRGGCRHRGKKAWGRTKCQLLRRDETELRVKSVEGWRSGWDVSPYYYCACHEWERRAESRPYDPYKGDEDPLLANPSLLPGYMEHVERRGFSVYTEQEAA